VIHPRITKAVTITCAAAALVAPIAQAYPAEGLHVTEGLRVSAPLVWPDGHQPQLRTSGGAISAPDNAGRSLPTGTPPVVTAGTASGDFDWADAAAGAAMGAILLLLAAGAVVVVRNRRLAPS
jgi:hypothetical protein